MSLQVHACTDSNPSNAYAGTQFLRKTLGLEKYVWQIHDVDLCALTPCFGFTETFKGKNFTQLSCFKIKMLPDASMIEQIFSQWKYYIAIMKCILMMISISLREIKNDTFCGSMFLITS